MFLSKDCMETKGLVDVIRNGLDIGRQIQVLVFGKDKTGGVSDDLFNFFNVSRDRSMTLEEKQGMYSKSLLSPLERIKIFNLIKRVVLRASKTNENNTKVINLKLFEGLVHEIRLRMSVEKKRAENGQID